MDSIKTLGSRSSLYFYFCIFFLSGFSGLIYESIWSRYLKLFLGNASYAQMVVIIIFMGGMAIGSALAAKYAYKLKNLILWYGICEAIIGLFGVGFHGIFTHTIAIFFDSIAPGLGDAQLTSIIKFSIAALIILPQSILLGATFPLITTGLLRKYPDESGNKIATLYFLNSLGAALGVLCSAFVLVPKIGLPGTALTSGIVNILLGIIVYGLSKGDLFNKPVKPLLTKNNTQTTLFLGIALVTGLASFMYEIAWIRMLSMVFGASTDAFEIMLSTFILGLALGALLIKGKVDKLTNPIKTLGIIQFVMGVLAMLTIPVYNELFEYLSFVKQTLQTTDGGYFVYNSVTFILSALMMLPATICAGTTLPLITHILLKKYQSESAVGTVYAFNTVGAILGVFLAVQVVMPSLGLKNVILVGSLLDITVGLLLIFMFAKHKVVKLVTPVVALISIMCLGTIEFDKLKMASGVFRFGAIYDSENINVAFHQDGKVSTVAVTKSSESLSISNNGKPDAAISYAQGKVSGDEYTMNLLGIIPLLFANDSPHVANIGFGSGLTAETLVINPKVKSIDTIEIEEKVVDASKLFYPKVDKVHSDPRSRIIIDDAKTVFSTQNKKYDVIISEPPNPWVSGVASLFTVEWYNHVKKHMQQDAIFAQWLQGYEMSDELFALIYNSLRKEFKYIQVFSTSGFKDFVIVASNEALTIKQPDLHKIPEMNKLLARLKINHFADLYHNRFIADQHLLDVLFRGSTGVNSDYFPVLDHLAPKARYKQETLLLPKVIKLDRWIHEYFYGDYYVDEYAYKLSQEENDLDTHVRIRGANDVYNAVLNRTDVSGLALVTASKRAQLAACKETGNEAGNKALTNKEVSDFVDDISLLQSSLIEQYSQALLTQCGQYVSESNKQLLSALHAFSVNDMSTLYSVTAQMLHNHMSPQSRDLHDIVISKLALIAIKRLGSDDLNLVQRIVELKIADTNLDIMMGDLKSK